METVTEKLSNGNEITYKVIGGTAWLREDVPAVVLDWLRALPDTDQTPAWV